MRARCPDLENIRAALQPHGLFLRGAVNFAVGETAPTLSDGRPAFSVHHHGLTSTQEALARTGNRLALALVTLGLYVSGALLTLHTDGPQVLGHLPFLAVVAFAAAGFLSLRLVIAITRSGHL